MDNPRIEVVIPTKNRYEFLALTIQSLTSQTYDNWDLIIVDDSDPSFDINGIPFISPQLRWMEHNKHDWRVLFGKKEGPHKCHQVGLDAAKNNYILRVDDDCIMTDKYIENLVNTITTQEHCGAVGGLVLDPTKSHLQLAMPPNWKDIPDFAGNIVEDAGRPNHSPALQWFIHRDTDIKPVQHLHSSFIYRKAAALAVNGWADMAELSKVGMTEETWFSYKLYLNGWNMFVNPSAISWHMKAPVGGTRENKNNEDLSKLYYTDREKFEKWYKSVKQEVLKTK